MMNLNSTCGGCSLQLRPSYAALQGDLPHDDTDNEEQDHQGQQPGAEALLLAGGSQRCDGAAARHRLPHAESIFFLWEQRHVSETAQGPGDWSHHSLCAEQLLPTEGRTSLRPRRRHRQKPLCHPPCGCYQQSFYNTNLSCTPPGCPQFMKEALQRATQALRSSVTSTSAPGLCVPFSPVSSPDPLPFSPHKCRLPGSSPTGV